MECRPFTEYDFANQREARGLGGLMACTRAFMRGSMGAFRRTALWRKISMWLVDFDFKVKEPRFSYVTLTRNNIT